MLAASLLSGGGGGLRGLGCAGSPVRVWWDGKGAGRERQVVVGDPRERRRGEGVHERLACGGPGGVQRADLIPAAGTGVQRAFSWQERALERLDDLEDGDLLRVSP